MNNYETLDEWIEGVKTRTDIERLGNLKRDIMISAPTMNYTSDPKHFNGWYYHENRQHIRHYVNGILTCPDDETPALIENNTAGFYWDGEERTKDHTKLWSFLRWFRGEFEEMEFMINSHYQLGTFKTPGAIRWDHKNKWRAIFYHPETNSALTDYIDWCNEMDIDILNMTPEDELLVKLKYS